MDNASAIEQLTKVVETGFAAMDRGFASVAEDIAEMREDMADIRSHVTQIRQTMATKEDVRGLKAELENKLASKNELSQMHRVIMLEIEDIKALLQNLAGFSKEIDHALERVAAIEKHLGINREIRA